ncbi:MAG: hypothetical protein K2X32_07350 [Phycisphaerales bacterium]|nr:hypothetical protein [Phycisphaerales bacterium]
MKLTLASIVAGLAVTFVISTVNVPSMFDETSHSHYQTTDGLDVVGVRAGPEHRVLIIRSVAPLASRGPFPDWVSPFDSDYQWIDATGCGWPMPVLIREEIERDQHLVDLARQRGYVVLGFRLNLIELSSNDSFRFHGVTFQLGGRVYIPGLALNITLYALACFVIALTAAATIPALRRRFRPDACAHCNYNLRGLPLARGASTTVCPECGTPVQHSPAAPPDQL